ncbi:hypothetical protein GpartN1_g3366.t1 [Galdieria partita]|uniref:E3 ubiquitin-protein ligase FANCL n=1 Tax=Galdieria partita TaxID=83374 RepID=A0A9C7UQG6_9RHOD|nr:hypothetical protein GpartN1_g3366.t1 [Galdieria partita]
MQKSTTFLDTCLPKEFPSLLVHTSESEVFQGIISVFEIDYFVRVEVARTSHRKLKLFVDNQLRQVLEPFSSILDRLSETCESAYEYLLNLRLLISRATAVSSVNDTWRKLRGSDLYRRLFDELCQVGWDCVFSIGEDLNEITFELVDAKERKHFLRCVLTDDYPSQAPLCYIEAPISFSFPWLKGSQPENDNLANIYRQCLQFIHEQQELFDVMDDWDNNTWILEPMESLRKHLYRRIALDSRCSLWIEISPRCPRGIPNLRFLGPEKNTAILRTRLGENLEKWNSQFYPRQNFEKLMNITFPSKPKTKEEKENGQLECGICYSGWLSGIGAPDIPCEMESCGKYYHTMCLYEWLRSLPDAHQSFDVYFGECPYCMHPIRVRKPEM